MGIKKNLEYRIVIDNWRGRMSAMMTLRLNVCFVIVLISIAFQASSTHAAEPYLSSPHAMFSGTAGGTDTHELIVLLSDDVNAPTPEEVVTAAESNLPLPDGLDVGNPIYARFGITDRAKGALLKEINVNPNSPRARLERYVVFTYPALADIDTIKLALKSNAFVLNVEDNLPVGFSGMPPSDPLYSQQWGLGILNLPAAWDYTTGHAYVGVVDVGIETDHEDLRPFNTLTSAYEGGNFRRQFSYDFGDNIPSVEENNASYRGHGTHVAGIIAATSNNTKGVTGACWNCSLMIGKSSDNQNYSSADMVARAYTWLVESGAQIINQSGFVNPNGSITTMYDCSNDPAMLCSALEYAAEQDVTMFAASGNNKYNAINFPARYYRVIAVGGIDYNRNFWDLGLGCTGGADRSIFCGSNFGPEQALVAPAGASPNSLNPPYGGVLSTFYTSWPWIATIYAYLGDYRYACTDYHTGQQNDPDTGGPGYDICTGTSMSSPFAAAIGGIIRGVNPLLSKGNVRDILISNTDRNSGAPLVRDDYYGYGIPDAAKAVKAALGTVGGKQLTNRLTPLFSFYSASAQDYFYTTVPQMALAGIYGTLQPQPATCSVNTTTNCTLDSDCPSGQTCIHYSVSYAPVGGATPGYAGFPCQVSPCPPTPGASVDIFTAENSPFSGGPSLVPLYRLSYHGNYTGNNPSHVDHTYATTTAELEAFNNLGYQLDGIEGYIYDNCTPEPSCIPPGAVKLARRYNPTRDDFAIFPESERDTMINNGYSAVLYLNGQSREWIGYAYPNIDSDGDSLIDGFERLIGTCVGIADTNGDGISDGASFMNYSNQTHAYVDPGLCRYIASLPTSKDFGNIIVGSSSTPYVFTISHTGLAVEPNLAIGTVSSSNPSVFSITSDNCSGTTLMPSGSCSVSVSFTPGTLGIISGNLTIPSNDPAMPSLTIALSGTGVNPLLTVTRTGSGTGTIASSPAGINCGTACSQSYSAGTAVTLTATPDANSQFAGWSSGGCSGTGNCAVTMNADTAVTATFNALPPGAAFSASPVTGNAPLGVTFTDLSTHIPTSWSWTFGDAETSTLQNPTHVYQSAGTYTVSLTATNIGGSSTMTNTGYITVQSCPNQPVRINSVYYSTLQTALDAAQDGDVIQAQAIDFTENPAYNGTGSVALTGGYDCGYSSIIGVTGIKGSLSINAGQMAIGNVQLEQ